MRYTKGRKIAGLPVQDATVPVTIHVTAGDVKKGKGKNPASCAAAIACKRQLNTTEVRVHLGRTYLRIGKTWVRYATPKSLRGEIISFDRGAGFGTGDFTLNPMPPSGKLGVWKATGDHSDDKSRKSKGKLRAPQHRVVGVRQFGSNK